MLCVWVHGCDPGRLSDGSRLTLYQTLSIKCRSPIFFSGMCFVLLSLFVFFFVLFLFCLFFHALVVVSFVLLYYCTTVHV